MKKITKKQQNILNFIMEFKETEGISPTIYEIAEHLDVHSVTVFSHIRALQRKGKISRTAQARSLKVIDHQNGQPQTGNVPLEDNTGKVGSICFYRESIGMDKCLAFKVPDDSMSKFGIFRKDVVIIELNKEPKSGDLVFAEVNGTSMLRSFYPSGVIAGNIELRPANPVFQSQRFHPSDIKVRGVVVALQRKY